MATTQDYINQLKIDKENLVSMLNNMGVEASNNETFTSLTPKVGKIVSNSILQDKSVEITENGTTNIVADEGYNGLGNVEVITNVASSGGKYAPKFISFSYYDGTELNEETTNLDTSNLTRMWRMFYACNNLNELNISHFNTSNVTDMESTFYSLTKLPKLDASKWDTRKVTTMLYNFYNCSSLTELDLSGWDTSNVTNMNYMFYNCTKLEKLDIRNFDFTKVKASNSYNGMFSNVPAGCEIIVKNATAKSFVVARRSDFTNVKTIAEL